jgi:hypothetical protein
MVDKSNISHVGRNFSVDYNLYEWKHRDVDVLVLHKEPVRIRWMATKLLTFIFLIPRNIWSYAQILEDYGYLLEFARNHKRSWLPLGFHCGYALLPIYIGSAFDKSLKEINRFKFKKHWCIFHVPSLLDMKSRELVSLTTPPFAGDLFYFPFISQTIFEVAEMVFRNVESGKGE